MLWTKKSAFERRLLFPHREPVRRGGFAAMSILIHKGRIANPRLDEIYVRKKRVVIFPVNLKTVPWRGFHMKRF